MFSLLTRLSCLFPQLFAAKQEERFRCTGLGVQVYLHVFWWRGSMSPGATLHGFVFNSTNATKCFRAFCSVGYPAAKNVWHKTFVLFKEEELKMLHKLYCPCIEPLRKKTCVHLLIQNWTVCFPAKANLHIMMSQSFGFVDYAFVEPPRTFWSLWGFVRLVYGDRKTFHCSVMGVWNEKDDNWKIPRMCLSRSRPFWLLHS